MRVCGHFGVCGGCAFGDTPYREQLKIKVQKVEKLLEPFWRGGIKITPSSDIEYFRNKIELSFCRQTVWKEPAGKKIKRDKSVALEFENALGFRLKGRWDRCIDLRQCVLFNDKLPSFAQAVRQWAAENNLQYYDHRAKTGVLRGIIMREGKNTGEGMIILVTAQPLNARGFLEAALRIYPHYGVLTAVNAGASDGSGLSGFETLKGSAVIKEAFFDGARKIIFELSPVSFFQTNTKTANLMYKRVREIILSLGSDIMYDLYGGAGGFSLYCSADVKKSVCVESVAAAVADGRRNAEINNIDNVKFVCAEAEEFLTETKINASNSVIVLDPPRSGLHPKAARAVLNSGVQNVLYISCNPATLAENMKIIGEKYKALQVQCFDFFPRSEHVETLMQLRLK